MGRGRQLMFAVATALALSACASKKTVPGKAPIVETISKKTQDKMTAKWKNGDCIFDSKKMMLTYTDKENSKTVKLDTELDPTTKAIELKPMDIICSDNFTVVIGEEYALVAQGADQIFAEFPMLGIKIDGPSMTNSYYLDIRKIAKEKIESVFTIDSTLAFVTEKKVWKIDLIDNSATSTER